MAAPSISLPKGGGAIRGMGEKFAANPVTGTGSLSVPIAISPGRTGFTPQLVLSYDSGAGNGVFGFGWGLSLPAITRKTDKGLPRYRDGDGSDVFVLSGAEDLVPAMDQNGMRLEDTISAPGFMIHRYRPRVEGLFARIERWTRADGDVHWRSFTKDNLLTVYGADPASRIFDPDDPRRVFGWFIQETRDGVGNATVYDYKAEDGTGVDLTEVHERNRGPRNSLARSAARYLKRVRYGNRVPLLEPGGHRPAFTTPVALQNAGWMFEVVLDYGEHDARDPRPNDAGAWLCRHDPFSTFRPCFEVRTYRLCQRILMFHHFPGEPEVGADCLVRSTDFRYRDIRGSAVDVARGHPVASFIASVTQKGYRRLSTGGYREGALPPIELEYSEAVVSSEVKELDAASLENLPVGVDRVYQWLDLDGEGVSGILTEQAGAWFYKASLGEGRFGPLETVARVPSLAALGGRRQQLLDLAGDGQLDLAEFGGSTPGFYERTSDRDWEPFRPFVSLPGIEWDDTNLRFVDLDGDGHADVLITEDDAFTWHPSLAEAGFGPAERVHHPDDEERGPRLVFGDGTQSVYLADMSGDGLADLVRIRNGEVCYWPNLGYGRFGAKVTMDNGPWFDQADQFRQAGVRLADIDGSGTSDLLYIGRSGVSLYFNESGNAWTAAHRVDQLPLPEDVSSVMAVDLLGNGTACLVWSSPLPGALQRPVRYVDLMGGQKPHLLIRCANNLGAETRIRYAASTRFYLADKAAGRPWITRLPFPVHVVERVETWDQISRNRFVNRYAYHHGYFDGVEREFRGFGCVEQWDSEQFATLSASDTFPTGDNVTAESHVPPVLTRTWFHTGVSWGREHVSDFFAGLLDVNDRGEYSREPGLSDSQARALLLDDTALPAGLSLEEEREACRALKGSILRQETYAMDGTSLAPHPYAVSERNYTVVLVQGRGTNRHAVFFVHPRETLDYQYERDPTDPRISHALTLDVDPFGNVRKSAAVGYRRRQPDASLAALDQTKQATTLVTYTENTFTIAIDDVRSYRTPLSRETSTYELTAYPATGQGGRYQASDFVQPPGNGLAHVFDSELQYEQPPTGGRQRRLIERVRTLYRPDDLGVAANDPLVLLAPGQLEPTALPGESYKVAFMPGLLALVYQRPVAGQPAEVLLPNPAAVLPANISGGQVADRGGYVDLDGDGRWWIPSGRVFHSPGSADSAATELALARQHFFLPRRYRDPFGASTVVTHDGHDLLLLDTCDAVGNRVTVGERNATGLITSLGNDYRVVQPRMIMDPNRNRAAVAFDTRGLVVATAVMGKPGDPSDSVSGVDTDLLDAVVQAHLADPLADPQAILGHATTRLLYDLFAYHRTRSSLDPRPVVVYSVARETHEAALQPGDSSRVQHSFSYSDGFGREIQKKLQAEPGPLVGGGPDADPRWVGSGWTIYNNTGKPVRQYESFFSATHRFEFARIAGVSPILFYDPMDRLVATLQPNHTYAKVKYGPWRQETWDANDTVGSDPRTDPEIRAHVAAFFATQPAAWQTWHAARVGGAMGAREQAAAAKAIAHQGTSTVIHLDTLGRPFLTVADNGLDGSGVAQLYETRSHLDIEGNQREVVDARGRVVMRYDYDMLGQRIRQASMEAGRRWTLFDVKGKSIRAWDSRGHSLRTAYDPLRRPLRGFVTGADRARPNQEYLVERRVYGEQHSQGEALNLRGTLHLHLDQAGSATTDVRDFKGNPLQASRRLAREYRKVIGWGAADAALPAPATTPIVSVTLENALAPLLETDTFTGSTAYDALNRRILTVAPHTPAMPATAVRFAHNPAGLLEQVDAHLRGAQAGGQPVWTPFVTGIDYDAKGQRTRLQYGNGVTTTYAYDPLTFRLVQLRTRRNPLLFPGDDPPAALPGWPGQWVQNLSYTYDPVGNITDIRDDAQQTTFFDNQHIEPSTEYTYDPLYRLTEATGREHLGLAGAQRKPPTPPDAFNAFHTRLDHRGDGNRMGTYVETYIYDEVGNIASMQHRGSNPVNPGWTRGYTYNEASVLEPLVHKSNRLTSTAIGGGTPEPNTHDVHGNVSSMQHLPLMEWDHADYLRASAQQIVAAPGVPETTWYAYDAAGERVRKVTESAVTSQDAANGVMPTRMKERLYLGGFEIYREYGSDGVTSTRERETLHVMDDKQRVALVETRTKGVELGVPAQLIRYQIGNHLGSSSLELDDDAQVVSYEEYFPFGSTSYQAVRNRREPLKRYRYTGKERDEESGFSYHGARYYAPWVGRWTACDPIRSPSEGTLYAYVKDNPVRFRDPDGRAEADTSDVVGLQPLPSNFQLNTLVNARIAAARLELGIRSDKSPTAEQRQALVDRVSDLGRPRGGNIVASLKSVAERDARFNKSEIEKIAGAEFPSQIAGPRYHEVITQVTRGKHVWNLPAFMVGTSAVNPSMVLSTAREQKWDHPVDLKDLIGTRVPVGTDKLGHFFAQGYEEFEISVLGGQGDEAAEARSFKTELGKYGLGTTGVFSFADLEANRQGREFYKRLYADPFMSFDIAEYVSEAWNEEVNPNIYSKAMEQILVDAKRLSPEEATRNEARLQYIKGDDASKGTTSRWWNRAQGATAP